MIAQNEAAKLRGMFEIFVFRKGILIERSEDRNLVVDVARVGLARLISGDVSAAPIDRIGFGTNNAAPTPGDTALTEPLLKTVDGHSFPKSGEVQFTWSLATSEGNGKNIAEFGLVSSDGSLFARKNRSAAIAKDSDISLSGTWTIQF